MYIVKNSKSPFYQLVYFVNGKRTTISTKTKIEKEAIRFLATFDKNNLEKKPRITSIPLSKFQGEYLDYVVVTKSRHYIRSVRTSFRLLIQFSGDVPLNNIDIRTLDKFITTTFQRTSRGASLYYRTLKAAFSKAVLWNYISENPFKKITPPKVAKVFPVFVSEIELKLILDNTEEQFLKDIFSVAFYTGMRLSELLNMKWSWIDLKQNFISIQCSEYFITKNKKERIIPIGSNIKSILHKHFPKTFSIKNDDYVFVNLSGKKLNENYVSKQFKRCIRKTQLDNRIHFHSLRHSFASLLAQKGVLLYVIKELLGHENLATTQIYSHLQQQNLRDAINLL